MSSADWDEVKRLAADFQRAQLASSMQRLSERNCVELIAKLNELQLLKLHYTTDGRCFVTPEQIHREIQDELFLSGGRINLVELSTNLCLDLDIIETEVTCLLSARPDLELRLIIGQLISPDYENSLAERVNEQLMKTGCVAVDDLATECQLPGDFIKKVIDSRLGSTICAVQDPSCPDTYFTKQHLSRICARIRGLLTAVSTPILLHKLLSAAHCNEKLFMNTVDRLVSSGRVCGEVTGLKQGGGRNCSFVPALYSRTQQQWIDNFLKQNGYLEYEFVHGLGVEDPVGYIQSRYGSSHHLLQLGSLCVGPALVQQIQSAVEDAITSHSFVDVGVLVPSCLSEEDRVRLVDHVLQQRVKPQDAGRNRGRRGRMDSESGASGVVVLSGCFVLSEVLVSTLKESLLTQMRERAHKLVAAGGFKPKNSGKTKLCSDSASSNAVSRKEERRRKAAAGGKTGGGAQGRESKTRSVKSKKAGRRAHDSEEEEDDDEAGHDFKSTTMHYLPEREFAAELSRMPSLAEADDDLTQALAQHLLLWAANTFTAMCEHCYNSMLLEQSTVRKKSFQQLQEKVLSSLAMCRLYQRGLQELPEDLQQQLSKYLLRTQCSELFNELLLHFVDSVGAEMTQDIKNITPEVRLRLISSTPSSSEGGCREILLAVHRSTAATDMDAFFSAVEGAVTEAGILLPKKKDNKRERQLLLSHRSGLLQQLSACCDHALCLHVAVLVLFQAATGHIIHASGKFVPQLIAYLQQHLEPGLYELLHKYQGLVVQKLTSSQTDDASSSINASLEQLTPLLQEKVTIWKNKGALSLNNDE